MLFQRNHAGKLECPKLIAAYRNVSDDAFLSRNWSNAIRGVRLAKPTIGGDVALACFSRFNAVPES